MLLKNSIGSSLKVVAGAEIAWKGRKMAKKANFAIRFNLFNTVNYAFNTIRRIIQIRRMTHPWLWLVHVLTKVVYCSQTTVLLFHCTYRCTLRSDYDRCSCTYQSGFNAHKSLSCFSSVPTAVRWGVVWGRVGAPADPDRGHGLWTRSQVIHCA